MTFGVRWMAVWIWWQIWNWNRFRWWCNLGSNLWNGIQTISVGEFGNFVLVVCLYISCLNCNIRWLNNLSFELILKWTEITLELLSGAGGVLKRIITGTAKHFEVCAITFIIIGRASMNMNNAYCTFISGHSNCPFHLALRFMFRTA